NGPVLNKPGNVEHFSDRAQVNARLGGGRLQLQLGPLVRDGLKSRSTAPLLSLQESTLLLRHLGLTKLLNFLGKPLPVVLVLAGERPPLFRLSLPVLVHVGRGLLLLSAVVRRSGDAVDLGGAVVVHRRAVVIHREKISSPCRIGDVKSPTPCRLGHV